MATLLVMNASSNAFDIGDVMAILPASHEFSANEDPAVWDAQEEQNAQDVIEFNNSLPEEAPAEARQADYVKQPFPAPYILNRNPGVPMSDFSYLLESVTDAEGNVTANRKWTLLDVNNSESSVQK